MKIVFRFGPPHIGRHFEFGTLRDVLLYPRDTGGEQDEGDMLRALEQAGLPYLAARVGGLCGPENPRKIIGKSSENQRKHIGIIMILFCPLLGKWLYSTFESFLELICSRLVQ